MISPAFGANKGTPRSIAEMRVCPSNPNSAIHLQSRLPLERRHRAQKASYTHSLALSAHARGLAKSSWMGLWGECDSIAPLLGEDEPPWRSAPKAHGTYNCLKK